MSELPADPQVVCPFVAFDDDRDFRAPGPDHRHRCFAEGPAAPRALAHQAAYCLAGAFPGCPTFVDWARREAAPAKVVAPIRSLRGPASAPRGVPSAPTPPLTGPAEPAARPAEGGWAAPPPWAGSAAAVAAGADPAAAAIDAAVPAPAVDAVERIIPQSVTAAEDRAAVDDRYLAPQARADDAPAFLAGRSARAAPAPPTWQDDEPQVAPDPPVDDRYAEPPADRPASESRRVPVGYAPVAYAPVATPKSGRRAGGSRREAVDPAAPSWEQPRRQEAYPTLKSRGGGGIPRPAVYALIVLLVGVGLFATPFLLKGIGGGGDHASPTPDAAASALPSAVPSPTPAPSPEQVVYTVKANDTLSKVAARYKVTVAQILAANPSITNENKIAVGDQIVIPQPLPSVIVNEEITPAP